ncbi:MAG: type II secretion system F family protein [Elusimicrobia bacterium]|nr:type II secretion system F family protein [Elusimicrobiota bacterium]
MPVFVYKARDELGKQIKGVMEAKTREALAAKLGSIGYFVTNITEQKTAIKLSFGERFIKVRTEDLILFNVQLANMIAAGLSLLTSLRTLTKQVENRKFREVIQDVYRSIEAGGTFSDSLAKHPKIFTPLMIHMIHAGEVSGTLDKVLDRLSVFAEHQADLEERIKSAMVYPIILVIVGFSVIMFLSIFLIPMFVDVFLKAGVTLPLPTKVVFIFSQIVKKYWYALIAGGIGLMAGLKYYVNTSNGRLVFDKYLLKVPVIGLLARKLAIARFARTLSTLTASGVPILECLEIVEKVVGNEIISRVIKRVREGVSEGAKLAEPLRISEEFPPDTIQMIAVGEESGSLDVMLTKIADFYDTSVNYSVKKLTTLIEPLFLILVGSAVGFLLASVFLPMFEMMKIIK